MINEWSNVDMIPVVERVPAKFEKTETNKAASLVDYMDMQASLAQSILARLHCIEDTIDRPDTANECKACGIENNDTSFLTRMNQTTYTLRRCIDVLSIISDKLGVE